MVCPVDQTEWLFTVEALDSFEGDNSAANDPQRSVSNYSELVVGAYYAVIHRWYGQGLIQGLLVR